MTVGYLKVYVANFVHKNIILYVVLADIGTLEMLVYNLKIYRKLCKFKHVFHFDRC